MERGGVGVFYHYKMSLPRGAWPSLACLVYHLLARESLARNVQLLLVCFSGITSLNRGEADFEFYVLGKLYLIRMVQHAHARML